jgi:hypothetical protein
VNLALMFKNFWATLKIKFLQPKSQISTQETGSRRTRLFFTTSCTRTSINSKEAAFLKPMLIREKLLPRSNLFLLETDSPKFSRASMVVHPSKTWPLSQSFIWWFECIFYWSF